MLKYCQQLAAFLWIIQWRRPIQQDNKRALITKIQWYIHNKFHEWITSGWQAKYILENLLQNFIALIQLMCAIEFLGVSTENNRRPSITLCEKAHICLLDYSLLSRSRIIYIIWNIYVLVHNRVKDRSQNPYKFQRLALSSGQRHFPRPILPKQDVGKQGSKMNNGEINRRR